MKKQLSSSRKRSERRSGSTKNQLLKFSRHTRTSKFRRLSKSTKDATDLILWTSKLLKFKTFRIASLIRFLRIEKVKRSDLRKGLKALCRTRKHQAAHKLRFALLFLYKKVYLQLFNTRTACFLFNSRFVCRRYRVS